MGEGGIISQREEMLADLPTAYPEKLGLVDTSVGSLAIPVRLALTVENMVSTVEGDIFSINGEHRANPSRN